MEQTTKQNQKPYNLAPNVEATLAYLLTPITGIVVYIMEKKNDFVRFHALQSILLGLSWIVLRMIARSLIVILIGFFLTNIVDVAFFIAWIFMMWKSYNNETYELPIIGQMAKDQLKKLPK